jgi:hypothetical protein
MKRKSTRIIFGYNNKLYKFMNFFVGSNDNSFYFHLYEEANGNLKTYEVTSLENGTTKVDLANLTEHDFKRNKISLHESGYIHSTNQSGKRLIDNVIGIPFKKIEVSNLILLIFPKKLDSLEEVNQLNDLRDVFIELPNTIQPFSLNFEIFRKSSKDKLATNHEGKIVDGYLLITVDDKEYGIRLYLQSINRNDLWPSVSFCLTRIV